MKNFYFFFTLISVMADLHSDAQILNDSMWSLKRCIQYAVENNLTVKKSALDLEQAEVNFKQAKASRLPNVNAGGSQSLSKGASSDPITYEFVSQTIHSSSASLSGEVLLWGANQINNTIQKNRLLVRQNELYVQESKNSIVLEITDAYIQALYNQEEVAIAENNVMVSSAQLERSKILYDVGSIALKDLADVESQHANNQYSLVNTKNTFFLQVLTLKQLLELDPEDSFKILVPESTRDTLRYSIPDLDLVYRQALVSLPEIKSKNIALVLETINMKIARADYLPTLSLTGQFSSGYTSTQFGTFRDQLGNNFNQQVYATLTIPIFNNLTTKASVEKGRIMIRSAELELQRQKKDVYRKIETAYYNAVGAQSEMESAAIQMNASRQSFDLSFQQYTLGALSNIDLVTVQRDYTNAQQKYAQAKYRMILYYQLLQFYMGNEINL